MNGFPERELVEWYRKLYPAGTRVVLVKMEDPYTNLRPGDKGTLEFIDDAGGAHIAWDNGEHLAAVMGEDVIRKDDKA